MTRQWNRELISRCYNLLIKLLFRNRFSDAQCGFKAFKGSVARSLAPQVKDEEWFFDTELLLLVEERGYRISEVPVDWIEDLDSRVQITSTAMKDVKGLLRIRMKRVRRSLSKRRSHDTPGTARRVRPGTVSSAFPTGASEALQDPPTAVSSSTKGKSSE